MVDTKSSTTYSKSVGLKEKRQDPSKNARYLYAAGELEGGKFFNDFLKNWTSEQHSAKSSSKTSVFADAFRLTVVDLFREFYMLKLNVCIYKHS